MASTTEKPVAIVTGAASGIGLNLSKLLVSRGWRVVMADVNEKLGKLQSNALGPETLFSKCDVSDWDSQCRTFESAVQKWGRIDFVAANAGLPEQVPLLTITGDSPKKPSTLVLDVDLKAVIYSVNLALFYMRQNGGKGGKIVVTASQAGIYGLPTGPIYAAAKAGCIYLVRSIAKSLAEENIQINAICPGLTDTGITHQAIPSFRADIITPMANHMACFEHFLDTDASGAAMEVDAGGMYNRARPDFHSKHQQWMDEDSTAESWKRGGILGNAAVKSV
ncbi:uncharacterized protein Z520_06531 [Fonsecaea multimorphosa CBS 102226]|uniref:Uncharacterized protein n=1 Tax=Fonsecaea multimorphosa CBS 102226 TaxID=1442371 RepID=A0A0D2KM40_9EURO|nr:uncharacterized protein Z520_06531 [Fonsecaea multimorphosa CBS 102226]KIX97753.1 hypothetical protein Z520_06531 [Fonsecaea multimorphosa CBS 102226]OAL23773.1 hypothetical protein AYO22_06092 [Fonsecaea multimorphosa]